MPLTEELKKIEDLAFREEVLLLAKNRIKLLNAIERLSLINPEIPISHCIGERVGWIHLKDKRKHPDDKVVMTRDNCFAIIDESYILSGVTVLDSSFGVRRHYLVGGGKKLFMGKVVEFDSSKNEETQVFVKVTFNFGTVIEDNEGNFVKAVKGEYDVADLVTAEKVVYFGRVPHHIHVTRKKNFLNVFDLNLHTREKKRFLFKTSGISLSPKCFSENHGMLYYFHQPEDDFPITVYDCNTGNAVLSFNCESVLENVITFEDYIVVVCVDKIILFRCEIVDDSYTIQSRMI